MRTINLSDYGIVPGIDISDKINEIFRQYPCDATYLLAPGIYHVYTQTATGFSVSLSNSDQLPILKAGLLFENMSGIHFLGHGATLLCHGQVSPLAILDSQEISAEGLTIDYAPTHNGEGVVLTASAQQVDVAVDSQMYPYQMQDRQLYFFNGDTYTPYFGAIEFDALTRRTTYCAGDRFRSDWQEEVAPGVIRFHGKFDPLPVVGNLLTLRHSPRIHPGILVHHCGNVTLSDITLYNTCGLDVLAQFSYDLRFTNISMRPNDTAGRRVVSCHDDGLHLSNNSGSIVIDGCYFHGLMDDPVNVHGTALRIREITDARHIIAEFAHDQSTAFPLWAQQGHTLSLIERQSMYSLGTANVESFRLLESNTCAIVLAEDIPDTLEPGDALENMTNTPQVTIQNSYFGSCRARGVLVSTPKPVIIRNNVFESSGTAILIPGDANNWYESGACLDVLIQGNHFTDGCLVSKYQYCEGVISICPDIPKPDRAKPFHRNIRILGNTFHVINASVLYALSTKGLTFTSNTVIRSMAYMPWHPRKSMVTLKACDDVVIRNNRFVGDLLSTEVTQED
jgi:hypothetical protein